MTFVTNMQNLLKNSEAKQFIFGFVLSLVILFPIVTWMLNQFDPPGQTLVKERNEINQSSLTPNLILTNFVALKWVRMLDFNDFLLVASYEYPTNKLLEYCKAEEIQNLNLFTRFYDLDLIENNQLGLNLENPTPTYVCRFKTGKSANHSDSEIDALLGHSKEVYLVLFENRKVAIFKKKV